MRVDQPERPVADPERLYRCRYRIQEQAGGHADRHPGVCRSRYLFSNDSVKLFKNPDLTQEAGKIPFYGIVYPYQTVADKGCVLVANKPQLDADSIGQTAIGWMDGRLLTAPEQQLHIDIASLPDSTLVFKDRERKDTLHLSSDEMRQKLQFADNQPTIRYSPVLSYRHNDTAFCFRTHLPMPVIDKRESYVLNVNGHPIYYGTFKHKIEEDLRK